MSYIGTVALANDGLTPYDILRTYYGDDIGLVTNAPVQNVAPSEPEVLLRLGSVGNDVAFIQTRLNRISVNYPAIPKIDPVDGVFGVETQNAVRAFQRIFNLTPDGIVGKATWYRVQFIYNAVKRLNELYSEGLTLDDLHQQFPGTLAMGATGYDVQIVQYYLRTVADYNPEIPTLAFDGIYDEETANAVRAFQVYYGLPETGEIDDATWNLLFDTYRSIVASLTPEQVGEGIPPFPGTFLKLGAEGSDVELLQQFINAAASIYADIPEVPITGIYDVDTRDAIYAVQATFGYPINGVAGPVTWDTLGGIYEDTITGAYRAEGQYSGNDLSVEEE